MVNAAETYIDLTIEGVETVPFLRNGGSPAPYPCLGLRPTGSLAPRSFRAIVLENGLIRAVIVPDLGGRILHLTDLRTGLDVLPKRADLTLDAQRGCRGAWLPDGIWWALDERPDRATSLAKVDFLIREEGEAGTAVLLFGLEPGQNISWHAAITLFPGQAELLLEVQAVNRSLLPVDCRPALFAGLPSAAPSARGAYSPASQAGFSVVPGDAAGCRISADASGVTVVLAESSGPLLPLEAAAWSARIIPWTGLGKSPALSPVWSAGVSDEALVIQSSRDIGETGIFLNVEGDQFAASAALLASKVFAADVGALGQIRSVEADGLPLLAFGAAEPPSEPLRASHVRQAIGQAAAQEHGLESQEAAFFASLEGEESPPHPGSPALEPAWRWRRAVLAARAKDYAAADAELERALAHCADNPLLWWFKAWVKRKGALEADRPELLNAHFLAPLEPLLRAESFLQQGTLQGREPNPIITPLAKNPDQALDVVHLLLELDAIDEASLLMDELLRHEEIGMVRALMAWLLATRSRMKVEAAQHAGALEKKGLLPPFPWRRLERQAVAELAAVFPNSPVLAALAAVAGSHPTQGGPGKKT